MIKLLLSIIALLCVSAYCPPTTAKEAPKSVGAPIYKDGEFWVYRVKRPGNPAEEGRVTYKDGKFVTDDASFWSSSIWATVPQINPTFKPLNFPLMAGKKWKYKYKYESPSTGRTSWRDVQVKVIGPVSEVLTTAAGQFSVIEIQRTENWRRSRQTRKSTYFYSTDSKSVVKMTSVTSRRRSEQYYELELIKYSVRK